MKKVDGELSTRQAERIIEQFENGSRNGQEWAHDVCLHRGTEKYDESILILNEAFKVKSIERRIEPLPPGTSSALVRKRMRR